MRPPSWGKRRWKMGK